MKNHWDDKITLREVVTVNAGGFPSASVTTSDVWAERMSIKQQEFYAAQAAGMRVDAVFKVRSIDYAGQRELICDGDLYDVVRTYQTDLDNIELTCARR